MIVQRVEMIAPLRHVYRLLRRPDRDRSLDKANARSGEAIAWSVDRTLWSSPSGRAGETSCTRGSEPFTAMRGSNASDSESLRPIELCARVNHRSRTLVRRSARSPRRSSAAMRRSVAPHTESPSRSDHSARRVQPIAALGETKRQDVSTHRTARHDHRTAEVPSRTARELESHRPEHRLHHTDARCDFVLNPSDCGMNATGRCSEDTRQLAGAIATRIPIIVTPAAQTATQVVTHRPRMIDRSFDARISRHNASEHRQHDGNDHHRECSKAHVMQTLLIVIWRRCSPRTWLPTANVNPLAGVSASFAPQLQWPISPQRPMFGHPPTPDRL